MQFNRMRLAGFKSFVDPTDLRIEKGLTGVVGPNGCGKSNLVEALRWVMGETSAKQMRGGEMDDVIFDGSEDRPARNIAEVVLSLDNSARVAPAPFNDSEELEVSRRIVRGSGSTYRINGKEVRARDVQLLFADSATGARSTALVGQGRVNAVITNKPTQRRAILEEAAGITGLHSRRHEAELRLRGAETNLTRLDDILVTLETQLRNLKKQARQATRFRNLSGHIRRTEATLFLLRWRAAEEELATNRQRLAEAETVVAELTRRAAVTATRQTEAAAGLPELRQLEVEAAAGLQRLILSREGLDTEERRIEEAGRECRDRLQQAARDGEREKTLAADAEAAIKRLVTEDAAIAEAREGEEDEGKLAKERLAAARKEVETLDVRHSELTERAATEEARRTSLARTVAELEASKHRLHERAQGISRERAGLERRADEATARQAAEAAMAAARQRLEAARPEAEAAENARAEASEKLAHAASGHHAAEAEVAVLEAEERALADFLEAKGSDEWPPLIDQVTVEAGLEMALGAALGDDLLAAAEGPAPVRWRTIELAAEPPPLPLGAEPLSRFVKAPRALARRLSQVGVVAEEKLGEALHRRLAQGQRLVGRDGSLWRWDGFTVAAGASAATARLEQRKRLAEVRDRFPEARAQAATGGENEAAARRAAEEAAVTGKNRREALREADTAYTAARDSFDEIKEKTTRDASRLAALTAAAEDLAAGLAETEARAAEDAASLAALPDPEEARGEIAGLRTRLAEKRAHQVEYQSAVDILAREAEGRQRRREEIVDELGSWRRRQEGAARHLEELDGRRKAITAELERLSTLPAEIAERRRALLSEIEQAEGRRRAAADRLAQAETKLADADRVLRQADKELAASREEMVRADGIVEQCAQARRALGERIAERLECAPGQLAEVAGIEEDAVAPDLEAVERRLERLQRERDTMGPVNLRAEQEAAEMSEQIETLGSERTDLISAIEKLRQGIAELNREGRERLLASFRQVDQHFQKLFVRLFGGGRAHLQLTDADDPLEAGLEIMASPPGKRMQMLSLLSGGEQALTALALLFSVFMTNPAPICVLDEVDAPLDDANVVRFCGLLEDIAQSGKTRFFLITHHRTTMARMDRLFGATMSERGVSQLVSVDLRQAEELSETG